MFRSRLAAAVVGAALVLSGCSQPSPPASGGDTGPNSPAVTTPATDPTPTVEAPATAEELIAKTQEAIKAAESVTAKVDFTSNGESLSFDTSGMLDGSNYRLTFTQGAATLDLILADDSLYMKMDKNYWAQTGSEPELSKLIGKWIKVNDQYREDLADITPAAMVDMLAQGIASAEFTSEIGQGTATGQDVFIVTSAKDETLMQFNIAADGTWLPVSFEVTGEKDPGALIFSDWNNAPAVEAPVDFVTMD